MFSSIIIISIILLITSLVSAKLKGEGPNVNLYINKFRKLRYNFGISHREFKGHEQGTNNVYLIDVINIGLILVDIEIEFYRKVQN